MHPPVSPAAAANAPAADATLSLCAAGERLTLPLAMIVEILRPRPLTRVPLGPPSLLGVANLRGSVLPVVSLARLLDRPGAAASPLARIVVVNPAAPFGLFVDAVATTLVGADEPRADLAGLLARDFAALGRRPAARDRTLCAAVGDTGRPAPAAPPPRALVGFRLGDQEYALPLSAVLRVARLPAAMARLPPSDLAMLGVVPFGGGVLPLVSPHALLGLPPRAAGPAAAAAARVVVTRCGAHPVGLVVDALTAIHRPDHAALDPVPPVLTRGLREARVEAICRLESGRLVTIIAPDGLFDSATAARLAGAHQAGAYQQETAPMAEVAESDHAHEQFVVFQLGDEQYGVPIARVDEVVRCPGSLTRVPGAPAFLEGVMNLRGQVVPVIDQRRRFAFAGPEAAATRRVVVLRLGTTDADTTGQRVGFLVDGVTEVLGVLPAEIAAAPELSHGGLPPLFDRVASLARDGRVVLLVDPEALLDRVERDLLAAVSDGAGSPT